MTTKRKMQNFAINLFIYREKRGLSKSQLSKIIDRSVALVSDIENGKRNPSLATALEICKKLDIDIQTMINDPIIEN